MKLLLNTLKQYRIYIALTLIIKGAGTFVELVIPYILSYILDYVVGTNSVGKIVFWGGVMVACALCALIANIVANRYKGIRAICASDPVEAFFARKDEDSNVLTIGSRFVSFRKAIKIIQIFLTSEFEGGRHSRRIAKY